MNKLCEKVVRINANRRKMTGELLHDYLNSMGGSTHQCYSISYFAFGLAAGFSSFLVTVFFAPAFLAGGFFVVGFLLPIISHPCMISYLL